MHDHRDLIASLALERGWERGVELGLGRGLMFRRLCAAGVDMVGVDLGRRPDRRAMVEQVAEEWPCRVLWMETAEAARHVDDGWADFVFVDAGHSYEAVKADIAAWLPKVRPGGWFGGHDYHPSHPGVVKAVDEAFPSRRLHDFWVWSRS